MQPPTEEETFQVRAIDLWRLLKQNMHYRQQIKELQTRMGEMVEHRRGYDRLAQVREFRHALGQTIGEVPDLPRTNKRGEEYVMQLRLISEEFVELLEHAFSARSTQMYVASVKESVGKLFDSVTAVFYDERHDNTLLPRIIDDLGDIDYVVEGLRQLLGVNGGPIAKAIHEANMKKLSGPIREDGKRLKPPGWQPPNIEGELLKQGWKGPLVPGEKK